MGVLVRPFTEDDLAAASRINRIAFGTFFGLPDPATFRPDADPVACRFAIDPDAAVAAELDGKLVGSGMVTGWGSVGILGPLTVDADYWSQGIARAIMPALVDILDRRGHALVGLFTHPQSPKHIRLYEAFDFWMRGVVATMSKAVAPPEPEPMPPPPALLFSTMSDEARAAALADCRAIAETVYPGLDLSDEIQGVIDGGFGDTLLLARDGRAFGFAVCHHGAASQAGADRLMVKFAAVRTGAGAERDFTALLDACERLAAARGAREIVATTNTGRHTAYRMLLNAGYRSFMNGVAMLHPAGPGYDGAEFFVIEDWR